MSTPIITETMQIAGKAGTADEVVVNQLDTIEMTEIFAMTDGVTDEQFESALVECKAEGDLSRASILQKLKTKKAYAVLIAAAWRRTIEGILEAGRLLIEARSALPYGEWRTMYTELPFSERTGERLMAIANHPRLAHSTTWSNLPTSWRALGELARISEADSPEAEIQITSEMTVNKARALADRFREREIDAGIAEASVAEDTDAAGAAEETAKSITKTAILRRIGALRQRAKEALYTALAIEMGKGLREIDRELGKLQAAIRKGA